MSRFRITKFVITETPWSSVIFKTIMVPLHRGRFLVVHLYSSFSMEPLDIAIFGDFGGRKDTFIKPQWWKLAWMWGPWTASPTPNFVKIAEVYYPFWENLYQKLAILAFWETVSPHFKSHNGEIWREGVDLPCKILWKSLKGIDPLGANFYQKLEIFAILSYLSPHFYTHNVEMLLKRTDLGIPQRHKISLESLKGSAVIALPRRWCTLISSVRACDDKSARISAWWIASHPSTNSTQLHTCRVIYTGWAKKNRTVFDCE